MSTTLGFGQIVIDCADAANLAEFWSTLLERAPIDGASTYFAVIPPGPDGSPAMMFLKVPEPRSGKNRMHIDLVSPERVAEVNRAVALGATQLGDFDEHGVQWTTLSDPEGNLFDIGVPHAD